MLMSLALEGSKAHRRDRLYPKQRRTWGRAAEQSISISVYTVEDGLGKPKA